MKVSGIGSTAPAGPTRRASKTDGAKGEFKKELDGLSDAAEASGVDSARAVAPIDALLAAQDVGDATDEHSRRRMMRRGSDILDKLEAIRRGFLFGGVPKDQLVALAQLVRSRRDLVADPRLAALMDEIELRAEVELAKLSSAP